MNTKTFRALRTLFLTLLVWSNYSISKAQVIYLSCETDSVEFHIPSVTMTSNGGKLSIAPQEYIAITAFKDGYRPASTRKSKKDLKASNKINIGALDAFPGTEISLNKKFLVSGAHWNAKNIVHITKNIQKNKTETTGSTKYLPTSNSELQAARKTVNILKDANLLDTTIVTRGFRDNQATFQLALEVDSLVIYKYGYLEQYIPSIGNAMGVLKWTVLDAFDKEIFSYKHEVTSVDLPINRAINYYYAAMFKDMDDHNIFNALLLESLYQFLTLPELTNATQAHGQLLKEIPNRPLLSLTKNKTQSSSVQESLQSTVSIKLKDSHGSGVILTNDGYIVTNYHVVGKDSTVQVITNNGDTLQAIVLRIDPEYDLALIKCNAQNFNPFQLANQTIPQIGSEVYSVGTPVNLSLGQTINSGIISALRNFHGHDFYQTDARVSGGNSGGALINTKGELIGIISSKIMGSGVEGICFAIPIKYIYERLRLRVN
jgi:Trypsin-like peptidase domain